MAKKTRFRNKTKGMQVIYDEFGGKRELVPNATILLDPSWAGRYKCLEKVVSTKAGPGRPSSKKEEES